jgi:hypothetical protein
MNVLEKPQCETTPGVAAHAIRAGGSLLQLDAEQFRADFGRRPFLIRHRLQEQALFALPRIVELSQKLPEPFVEYNAGKVPVSLDPHRTPRNGLSIEETIRRIEDCGSWIGLRYVNLDKDYCDLMDRGIDEIEQVLGPLSPGIWGRAGFLFISSPSSVTPFHVDPEYNFLLQVRGHKTVHLFDCADRAIVSEEDLEGLAAGKHRNLVFKDEYQAKAYTFHLKPGDGLHFPYTWPHWVENGAEVSISYSITFQTRRQERRNALYNINHQLRKRGLRPRPVGGSRLRDTALLGAYMGLRSLKRFCRGQFTNPLPRYRQESHA